MITFSQARMAAVEEVQPQWPELGMGTLYADPKGYEDADLFAVNLGAREFIKDGDPVWNIMNPPMALVDKATGAVLITTYLEASDLLDKMSPVSVG